MLNDAHRRDAFNAQEGVEEDARRSHVVPRPDTPTTLTVALQRCGQFFSMSRVRHMRRLRCRKWIGGATWTPFTGFDVIEAGEGRWDIQLHDSLSVTGHIWHTGSCFVVWDWADRQIGVFDSLPRRFVPSAVLETAT